MNTEKQQEFAKICRLNGWRCTSQRLAVYEFIDGNYSHPDVDIVWNHVKKTLLTVTRESIYRILNEFAATGILHRLDHLDSARYDSQTCPHGHFICEKCGKITDFALPDNTILPANPVAGKANHIELRISGVCEKCETNLNEK